MIVLKGVEKVYRTKSGEFPALRGVDLVLPEKGFVAILGPSGCGKTTLLNLIGGLDHPSEGEILVDGESTKSYKDRDWDAYRNERIGFVFQNYNLISHQSVLENVSVSLSLAGIRGKERERVALEALEKVGVLSEARKRPSELSGGQMQRVAIARAIVNRPSVVLADEPTGALDSKTSAQVMDLLKEISEERLVVMVTHNRALAEHYADRIVEMEDGEIKTDSNPCKTDVKSEVLLGSERKAKTSMGILSAIRSSLGALWSKKGRTSLTVIASAFGVLGVSLVLAISNGFGDFVTNVEEEVASAVPMTISRNFYSVVEKEGEPTPDKFPEEDVLYVHDTSTQTYVSHTNDLNNREYIDGVLMPLVEEGLARSVLLNREGLDFNIITEEGVGGGSGTFVEVNQYQSAGLGSNMFSGITPLPSTIFHELYADEEGLSSMYDLIYGEFPEEPNELVLILDQYNRVDINTLRSLGFFKSDEALPKEISFKDIVGDESHPRKTYKAFPNSEYLSEVEKATGTVYEIDDFDIARGLLGGDFAKGSLVEREFTMHPAPTDLEAMYESEKGIELKIVGVIRPSENSYFSLMPCSIGYLPSLAERIADDASSPEGEALGEDARSAWFVPRSWSDENGTEDGLERLNRALKEAFQQIASALGSSGGSASEALALSQRLQNAMGSIAENIYWLDFTYLNDEGGMARYTSYTGFLGKARSIGTDFKEDEVAKVLARIQEEGSLASAEALALLGEVVGKDFLDPYAEGLSLIDFLAYISAYSNITSILIFPESLTAKPAIIERLDAYNDARPMNERIYYTDIMGSFTDALSTLIDLISLVLTVFGSLSLVVSSIMTAIITYVSVIERTKEIGILRACGARKRDVGGLFLAECLVIGFVAGVLGVLATLLLSLPINQVLASMFPGQLLGSIASLSAIAAVAMIFISTSLSLISGLIPSRIASKKDPAVALRAE